MDSKVIQFPPHKMKLQQKQPSVRPEVKIKATEIARRINSIQADTDFIARTQARILEDTEELTRRQDATYRILLQLVKLLKEQA